MAALPPPTDLRLEDDEERDPKLPEGFHFIAPEEPSFTDMCWRLAQGFALFLVFTAIGAYAAMLGWNSLVGIHHLTEIEWREAFTILILLRIVGLALGRTS